MGDGRYTVYGRGRARRRLRLVALSVVVLLGALAGCGAYLARDEADRLPPRVEIAGVDVGGMTFEEAQAALATQVGQLAAEPILLDYPGGSLQTSGAELGVEANVDEVLARARESRDPLSRLGARLGLSEPISYSLDYTVDDERLAETLDRVSAILERKPVPARVAIVGEEIVTTPAKPGLTVNRASAAAALASLPDHVRLELLEVRPRVDDDDAALARARAEALILTPPLVRFRKTRFELPPELLRESLRFERRLGAIELRIDPQPLAPPLEKTFARYERDPVNADFRVEGKRAAVVPSVDGRALSVEQIAGSIAEAGPGGIVKARFDRTAPDLTTREAKAQRVRRLISEFTTPYSCCQPRVTNIQRAAQILDGTLIRAGARFSLNETLGERTAARGFVSAPMILAGRLVDAIGGGVSQIATTVYNAAFFAGLELIAHTPHQFYISRYPMGREATVSWGGPELIFRNDWPAGILMKVIATDSSITVRFYSSKLGRRIETATGEPYAYTAAQTLRVYNPSLPAGTERVEQSGGISGFTVEYTRKVYQDGTVKRDERFKVRYDPEHSIIEYGPPVSSSGGGKNGGDGSASSEGPAPE